MVWYMAHYMQHDLLNIIADSPPWGEESIDWELSNYIENDDHKNMRKLSYAI